MDGLLKQDSGPKYAAFSAHPGIDNIQYLNFNLGIKTRVVLQF